jgi:prepilin-type N-terminal cleavage/methylation domain-containing protein
MHYTSRRAITLIECLVVLAIIVILFGLLSPATRKVRDAAARSQCSNNLKQLAIALHSYHDMHRQFPHGSITSDAITPDERLGWMVELLPHLEQELLAAKFDRTNGYTENRECAGTHVRSLYCPGWQHSFAPEMTHYMALAGIHANAANLPAKAEGIGFMGHQRKTTFADITDGTSNTIIVMESSQVGEWARGSATIREFVPTHTPFHGADRAFGGMHIHHERLSLSGPKSLGVTMAMGDGSVRFAGPIQNNSQLFATQVTIAGGESYADW